MVQGHLLYPSFEAPEVVASVGIATIASFAALTLAARVAARRGREQVAWLAGGGVAMGLGIAAMHFVGLLSMRLPVPVAYEAWRTVLSVVIAIAASTLALALAGGATLRVTRLASGGVLFGGAMVGMHYIGMSAIRGPVTIGHDASRVALSMIVAIANAAIVLWLTFRLRDADGVSGGAFRILSAPVMGMAIAAMHYTATSAARFHDAAGDLALSGPFDGPLLVGSGLSASIVAVAAVILVGAIFGALIDQNAGQVLRDAQRTLEYRVAEHEAEAAMATELYRLLAEHATDMVSMHRPDGRFDYATPSWAEFVGAVPSGVLGRLPAEFCHPDDVAALAANHLRVFEASGVLTTFWRCRRPGGSYAWVETTTRTVRDPVTNRVQTFVCTTRDVTERKRMEEELDLLNGIVVAVGAAPDLDSALEPTLRRLCEATGWSYGEAWTPAPDETALHRAHVWYAREGTDAAAFTAASLELSFVKGEGTPGRAWQSRQPVWIRDIAADTGIARAGLAAAAGFKAAAAVPVLAGDSVVAVLSFFMAAPSDDDSHKIALVSVVGAQLGALIARRRVEVTLSGERHFLSALLDSLSEGIIACDATGRVTLFNRTTRELHADGVLAVPYEDVAARLDLFEGDGVTPLSPGDLPLTRVLRGEDVRDHELIVRAKDGQSRALLANGRLIIDDAGHHLGAVVATRDVTDWKHAEDELRALTLVDDLTGLYNRRGFRMLAEQHLRLVKRGGPISLLACFDLNDFKRVNDLWGHAEGDAALRRTASILRTAFRDSDIIARFGGDEFVVLALDCGEIAAELMARVDVAVAAHNAAAARPYDLSLAIGTARFDPFARVSLDELLAAADASLYEAKRRDREHNPVPNA